MPVIDLGSVVGPQGPQGATGATGAQGIQGNPGPNQVTDQTSTNLNGVLFGNQSRVTVKPVDSDPTADSTNLVSSGGTDKAIKGRVPVYGLGKNLLRNAYFVGGGTGRGVFPVNQRGQTSYSSNASGAYSMDNWKVFRGTANLQTTGLSLAWGGSSSGNYGCYIRQYFDLNSLLGRTVTLSAFTESGLYTVSFEVSSSYQIDSDTVDDWTLSSSTESALVTITVWRKSQTAKLLYAAKLELGSEQTLCHNEGTAEAPVWVLNEVPDYDYELFRCQTSTADSSDDYANKSLATEQQLTGDCVETGTTASRAYAAGDYFCWHGLTYRAKTNIGAGDTFTVDTNCILSSEGGLNAINNDRKYALSFSSFQWHNNADLNTFLSPGIYWIGQNATHSVSTSPWCPLLVLTRGFSNPDTATQIFFLDGHISTRRLSGGAWTPWKTVVLS